MNLRTDREYLYFLPNASLTLRLIEHLHAKPEIPVLCVTIIHEIDGWLVRIKLNSQITPLESGNLRAFLNELGISHKPQKRLQMALLNLESGQCPIKTMRRYQISIVSHGSPNKQEIEAFREQFVRKLGYCPQTLV